MKRTTIFIALASALSLPAYANDQAHKQGSSEAQSSQQNSDVVKQAQQKLSDSGKDVGKVDGQMGPKTQAALKEFQQEKGLQASGQLDQETLAALDLDQGSSAASGGTSSRDSTSSEGSPSESSGTGRAAGDSGTPSDTSSSK